ncbi:hypothetical protein PYW07_010604 [Mythimna separata]|uniref:Nose resistant-to-fluoxetine protein N-terminal domain-containing protein n=1 Tax=Mythimna separata TaxID=271217 RepID=A0AAD8DMI3_MYTSE|nr:hypothetical protein PYW07_010604 [Mythimna separata]
MWYSLLIFICIAKVSSHHAPYKHQHTVIDAFIHRLQLETWEKEEAPCLEKTLTLLENVKNFTLWATWIWNANTVPMGNLYGSRSNLGSFDQCTKPPWLHTHPELRPKYCWTELVMSDKIKKKAEYDPYGSTEEYLTSPTITGLPVNHLAWGLCVPAACHPPSVLKITRSVYELTSFGAQAPNITVHSCQVAGEQPQPGIGFYLFIALILTLTVIAVASTYYRLRIANDDNPSDNLKTVITKSFCIIRNRQDLVKDKEDIRVMNGMRFLTAASIIILHEIFYSMLAGIINSLDLDKDAEGVGGLFLLHIDVIVDTFFVMSGLLHIKGLLNNIDKQQNLFSILWKRYVRLIGPFALVIFYLSSVSKYTGTGPVWDYANDQESEVCHKTWRLSLLMLNTNPKFLCHTVTWYVPCDYQLTILATALFYFYQKNRRLGFAAFGTAAVLSLIIPGVLTYWYQLPGIHFLDLGRVIQERRDMWEVSVTYTPSYSRAGAYLVGVAMGYLMTLYKPSEHRNTVSKSWSIVGTALSLCVMTCVMSLGQYCLFREYNPVEAAVIASTNRVAWAVAICVIIGLCEYGTVPIVTDILSFSYFTPLSRLSYGIYMTHTLLVQRDKFTVRSPLRIDYFSLVLNIVGILSTAIGVSFAMWLFVEAPLTKISNHFLFDKPKIAQPIEEQAKNGIQHKNGNIKTKEA